MNDETKDNLRHLFGGAHATPNDILEKARELNPRFLLVSLVDEHGHHVTLISDTNALEISFLIQSSQAQINQFLLGRES